MTEIACPTCSEPMSETARFCPSCGKERSDAAVIETPSMPAAAAPVPPIAPASAARRGAAVKSLIGTVLVLVLIVGVVAALSGAGKKQHTIGGTFTLTDDQGGWSSGSSCEGSGGYSDITSNAQVTVKDGNSKTLAVGSLGEGMAASSSQCIFPVSVSDVPDSKFYAVSVGHRGELTFTADEMKADDYTVGFTLGS